MSLIKLTIKGISYSQTQSGAYALVLSEMDGKRTLPIIIGAFEAQSIAIALEKEIRPPRPLTHDLFKTFSERFHITVKQVIIHKLVDGIFFSSLICEKDGVEEIIDTRTSDAIAIAIRFLAPIYTYENILDKAGIYLKIEEEIYGFCYGSFEKKGSVTINHNLIKVTCSSCPYTVNPVFRMNARTAIWPSG